MLTFFLLGRTTQCPVNTLHIGHFQWLGQFIEVHAWGISILYCNPANDR